MFDVANGGMPPSENARTTEISETAGTVPAHDPNHASSEKVYTPKKVSYSDSTLGIAGPPGGA